MTRTERSILMHLHLALVKLDTQNARDHEVAADILQRGYQEEFIDLCVGYLDETASPDMTDLVHKVLDMYRWLQLSYRALPETQRAAIDASCIKFGGFDGNNETEYMGYAQFVREKLGRWAELEVEDYNSHRHMAGKYVAMLGRLPQRTMSHATLTAEEIQAVIAAPLVQAAE